MPPKFSLFAYGTLQLPEVMAAVAGGGFPSEPARLADHARYCLVGHAFPGLCREPGAATAGRLYHGLDAAAMARLDAFEDAFYRRESVTVTTESGLAAAAEVYLIPPEHHSLLLRIPWDLENFRSRHLADFLRRRAPG